VDCVATCEVDLSTIWEAQGHGSADIIGGGGDIIATPFQLVPTPERADAYPGGSAGEVVMTLVAAKALRALRKACGGAAVGGW
jgi:hypothetical protein